jgi:uncharacterized membrane protein
MDSPLLASPPEARTFQGRRWLLGLAGAGMALSLGLEVIHRRAYLDPDDNGFCSFGASIDCSSVALSSHSVLLGVPVALWGCAGFLGLFLAAWQGSRWLLPLAALAAGAGVAFSALSAFVIGAWCLPCELAHTLSAAIAVLAWRARGELASGLGARAPSVKILAPPLALLLAAVLVLPRYWSGFGWRSELPFHQGRTQAGYAWIGAEQPRLTLEEFVDYSCPHCKAASARSLMRLAEHRDTLRIVRRFYPRTMCEPRSEIRCLATRLAFCAEEQGRFWRADRWLFEHAAAGHQPDLDEASLDLGLDRVQLGACVARDATFERAVAEWRRAKKLHIPGTPYYASGDQIISAAAAARLIDSL